jgi:hypothetical protein
MYKATDSVHLVAGEGVQLVPAEVVPAEGFPLQSSKNAGVRFVLVGHSEGGLFSSKPEQIEFGGGLF